MDTSASGTPVVADLVKLDEGITWCAENPELHDQGHYAHRVRCGTTLCLAGAVLVLNGWKPEINYSLGETAALFRRGDVLAEPFEAAMKLLNLTDQQAEFLFIVADGLDELRRFRGAIAEGRL